MTSVLRELPLSYVVLSEGRRCGSASAVHEPSPAGPPDRASSIAPAGPSARATPPRRSPKSSTSRVRLHLKPGQKGTKQLLAQCGDRLICVRYRYDAQRKKRFKTVELLVAERDWEPPRPRFAHDQVVGFRVAFADVAVRDQVSRREGRGIQSEGSGSCATIGAIQVKMLASAVGCWHLVADDGVAVQ
jgi:hypothetical protein